MNVKFPNEPHLPPRTGYELFQQLFKRDCKTNYNAKSVKEFWLRTLKEEKRSKYANEAEDVQSCSESDSDLFLSNMSFFGFI